MSRLGLTYTAAARRRRNGLSLTSQFLWAARVPGHWPRVFAPRFAGVSLRAPDPMSAWGISYHIASGEYLIEDLVPERGDRVVDVGANIGVYSLWAALRGAVVTAYEPAPQTFAHLVDNTAGLPIEAINAAVVGSIPEGGSVRLFMHPELSTRNSLLGREIGTGDELTSCVTVSALSLDDVLHADVDLLKIDCEGAEFDQFERVSDLALRRTKRIILEFHRTAGDPLVLLERLNAAGFDASVLEDSGSESFGLIGARRRD
jgi:FkbM family methyltransferase